MRTTAAVLIALLLVNHAVDGALSHERYTPAIFAVTLGLSVLMVSNIPFRSFKDLRLGVGTALLVLFVIATSVVVPTSTATA